MISIQNTSFLPNFLPEMSLGKLTYKIVLRKDQIHKDGTASLYLRIYDGKIIKKPIDIRVKPKDFDATKGLVKKSDPRHKDYNLIIKQRISKINDIEVQYRLQNKYLDAKTLINEVENPSARLDFNVFASGFLESQKNTLKKSTYLQQKGSLSKIKKYKKSIPFYSINEDWVSNFKAYLKNKLNNNPATIESTMKNFKKMLRAAEKIGIIAPLKYSEIKVKRVNGNREFLEPEEVKILIEYSESQFINDTHKHILNRFLFSCFTGLRISDIEQITEQNIIGDYLALTMVKTNKFIKIKLNERALKISESDDLFENKYTREYTNRELKKIMSTLGIVKRISYHCSRHTFATNFLIAGGRVENLQKLLGHSEIKETMIYVHIMQSYTDSQIHLMDNLFKD